MAKATGSANVGKGLRASAILNSFDVFWKVLRRAQISIQSLIVLIVVVGALLVLGVGNFLLYQYAQKNVPSKKKKPLSKKKLKKERLKGGVRPAGD